MKVDQLQELDITMAVRCSGVRGADGATARVFFLDEFGKPVPGPQNGRAFLRWTGSFSWRVDQAKVSVPPGSTRAVLQIDKLDSIGTIRIDEVRVMASPDPTGRRVGSPITTPTTLRTGSRWPHRRGSPPAVLSMSRSWCRLRRAGAVSSRVKEVHLQSRQGRPCTIPGREPDSSHDVPQSPNGPTPWPIACPAPASTSCGWEISTRRWDRSAA